VVLLHELAHVARGDALLQSLAMLAFALHWYNPLLWLAIYRMHTEREAACDDLVLNAGIKASAYAAHLLEIAALARRALLAAHSSAMARPSPLGRRLRAVLDPRLYRSPITQRFLLVNLTMALGLVLLLAVTQYGASHVPRYTVPRAAWHAVASRDGRHLAFVVARRPNGRLVIDRLVIDRDGWITEVAGDLLAADADAWRDGRVLSFDRSRDRTRRFYTDATHFHYFTLSGRTLCRVDDVLPVGGVALRPTGTAQ